ncbi:MAG: hypothetical protein RLZZ595_82 [Bacteroidota bacterium]|jgi:hypothetical protein
MFMRLFLIGIIGIFHFVAPAQNVKPRLQDLPFNDLTWAAQASSNWMILGDVQSGYNDTSLNLAKGNGILFNNYSKAIQFKPGHHLVSKMQHGDIVIAFDFMIPKGSNSGIYLQSRYEVQIADSWGVKVPKHGDMGGIYERWENEKGFDGKAPMKNAALAPGLWQHMEISFQAPRFDPNGKKISPAKFIYVKLNGTTLHENIFVSGPTRAALYNDEKPQGPLLIQGDHGQIAIKNFKYAPQEELNVSLKDLSYTYHEKSANTPEEALKITPTAKGKTNSIDARLAQAKDDYLLQFKGKLIVPSNDTYTFSMLYSGDASLEIDGEKVIPPTWTHTGGYDVTGSTELQAGDHDFVLWVNKDVNWSRSGLSVFIEKPNSKSVALHSPASIPERAPAPLIAVKAENKVEMVRSFMEHRGRKLTHVVSVGDPAQVHYAYDLMQGALLQVWKGDFLNTTEMWYERGEPQTATPLGAPIGLSGFCLIYDKSLAKDSNADYRYKGYTLSNSGNPIFNYAYKQLEIKDHIVVTDAAGRGLKRTIVVSGTGKEKQMIRIAQGQSITPIGNGLYGINNQTYFVQLPTGVFPKIETYNNEQVLLLNGSEPIQYQLIW